MLTHMRNRNVVGFTLVEIMIVVAIIAILAAISIPSMLVSRIQARENQCMSNLKVIDYSKEQAALSLGTPHNTVVPEATIRGFCKDGIPTCPSIGGSYAYGTVGNPSSCAVHGMLTSPTPLSSLTD